MVASDALQPSGPLNGYVGLDYEGMDESQGSDDPWDSDPESVSYSCGETPPLRPNRPSSENLDQDTLRLSTAQENAHVAPDKTTGVASGYAARLYRKFKEGFSSRPELPPGPVESNFTSLSLSNITWGPTTVLGNVKETDVSTRPRPIVTWGPTTVPRNPNSPPGGALGTHSSQHIDSDDSSTRAIASSSDESIKLRRRKRHRKRHLLGTLNYEPMQFELSPELLASSTLRPESGPAPLEGNESQKQKSKGAGTPHVTDSEPLKTSETFKRAQSRFEEPKGDAEVLLDEHIQQQEDESRGPLVVPTVSDGKRWAGFDVEGHEPGSRSMDNAELDWGNPGSLFREHRKDMITPDGITYSTPVDSKDGGSDDDDAVLHPKASGMAIPSWASPPPRGHRGQFISDSEELDSFLDDVNQAPDGEQLEFVLLTPPEPRVPVPPAAHYADEQYYYPSDQVYTNDAGAYASELRFDEDQAPSQDPLYTSSPEEILENTARRAKGLKDKRHPNGNGGSSSSPGGNIPSPGQAGSPRIGQNLLQQMYVSHVHFLEHQIKSKFPQATPEQVMRMISDQLAQYVYQEQQRTGGVSINGMGPTEQATPQIYAQMLRQQQENQQKQAQAAQQAANAVANANTGNQHELSQANGAGQSQTDTVPTSKAIQGQATDMLDDSLNPPQYVRENEFHDLFTWMYPPPLDSLSRNERRSSPTEDERETGLLLDDFPLLPPPFYRSRKSDTTQSRKRQPSPAPSVESLQSLVDSIFSLASLSSASTAPGLDNAFQRVLAVLQADAVLKDLYAELTARTSAIKFKRNLGTLLKRFAVDLENESSCYDEQRTAKFIRSRARKIAQRIVDAVYPSGSTIERAQTSTSLGKARAESSEDSETDEEPDEYLELEKFVTNSRSFQKLRDNIRAFLGLELSKLLAELPFVDEDQLVEDEESINSGQNARSCGKTVWSMRNFYYKIRDLLLPEPPIPNGLSRVRWKCPCGETLYDDYQELRPGAAKRMEDYLRRSSYKRCAGETKSLSERISNVWSGFKSLTAFVTQWNQTLKNNGKITIVNTELRYYSDARTTRTPAHTSGEVFYLLLCHNSGVGAEVVKLRQPDICDINNDQKLFSFLHEEYLTLRKRWWTWISLWTLQSIKFVRFELYENELVDVKKLDDVPPPTKDHEYRHGPPNPPELNPPLGSTLLMHLFKHPELAGTRKKYLQKIPRKLRNRLAVLDENDDAIGWGLQFIEGWSKKRLMYMTALTFGFSSVVVMVLVSILGHDVQNAGAIASFMLSFVTIGIATAQAAMHMN